MEDYEKKYKEALERARKELNTCGSLDCDAARQIFRFFPELKEFNAGMIKKRILLSLQKDLMATKNSGCDTKLLECCIDWLEKQHTDPYNGVCFDCYGHHWSMCARDNGVELWVDNKLVQHFGADIHFFEGKSVLEAIDEEKVDNQNCVKPVTKIEPKFKVGDWVVNNEDGSVGQITNLIIDESGYGYNHTNGWFHSIFEKDYHLWTIEDAKDGDVLAFDNDTIVIFKNLHNTTSFSFDSYCHIKNGVFNFSRDDDMIAWCNGIDFHPATKEQRDLLFQKMKEVGYEWDAEEKELKEIENKRPLLSDFINAAYERGKADAQKLAWSEEDEQNLNAVLSYTDDEYLRRWLKDIIHKKYDKPAKWSEEDEGNLQGIIDEIEANKSEAPEYDLKTYDRFLSWLKSLKERLTWQPVEKK